MLTKIARFIRVYSLIVALVLAVGCRQNDNDPGIVVRMGAGDFNITLNTVPFAQPTKAQQAPEAAPLEEAIFNLHVFLIPLHTNSGTGAPYFPEDARHYYFEFANPYDLGVIKLDKVFFGKYKIYILANNGARLNDDSGRPICNESFTGRHEGCALTSSVQVEAVHLANIAYPYIPNISTKRGIPMVYIGEGLFGQNPTQQMSFTLTRLMAKVYLGEVIIDDPTFFELKQGWRIVNAPQTLKPFVEDYVPEKYIDVFTTADNQPAYILTNPRIDVQQTATSELERTQLFAPKRASYIFMEGYTKQSGHQLDYGFSVYLGELGAAGSEDWNNYIVAKNSQYPVNVHFRDMTRITDDPRISQTSATVTRTDFSAGMTMSSYTSYVIEFEVTYKNVYNEDIRLYLSTDVPGATDDFIKSQKFNVSVNSEPDKELKPSETLFIPILDASGEGKMTFKIAYQHTESGPGVEGAINFILSNSRGRIQEFRYSPVTYN